jgi:hypothetical protein
VLEGQGADTAKVAASLVASLNEIARRRKDQDAVGIRRVRCVPPETSAPARTLAVTQDLFAVVDSAIEFREERRKARSIRRVEPLIQMRGISAAIGKVPTRRRAERCALESRLISSSNMGVDTPTIFCAVDRLWQTISADTRQGLRASIAAGVAAHSSRTASRSAAQPQGGPASWCSSDGPARGRSRIADPRSAMTPASALRARARIRLDHRVNPSNTASVKNVFR